MSDLLLCFVVSPAVLYRIGTVNFIGMKSKICVVQYFARIKKQNSNKILVESAVILKMNVVNYPRYDKSVLV